MTLSHILNDVAAFSLPDCEVSAIVCDSRKVGPGCVFAAIPGTALDGHDYAAEALEQGAAAVVVQRDLGLKRQIIVPNARKAWAQMAANWFGRPAEKLHLTAVTGTNGKTSTTYYLKTIFEACGHKTGIIGTVQSLIGDEPMEAHTAPTTPDPYELQHILSLMLEEGCTHAAMEASSIALDQYRLDGCTFDAGIFTNLTQDHLDYHGNMENYMRAKKRLFDVCRVAVVNLDDEWAGPITEGISVPKVTYSIGNDNADYTARNIRQRPDGMDFELVGTGEIARVRLPVPGMFSVYNALAAASAAVAQGMPFETVTAALEKVPGIKGRAEIVPIDRDFTGRDFTVVIDYAHTPDGLLNIGRTMKEGCRGKLMILFGCGGGKDRGKRPLMAEAAARYADFLVVTSDNPRGEDPMAIIEEILPGIPKGFPHKVIADRTEAIRFALDSAKPGDTVVLAGKGHETYQILKDKTIHMDEREIVKEWKKQLKVEN